MALLGTARLKAVEQWHGGVIRLEKGRVAMARWPDERKANVIAIGLVFALFPLLCWLCWWWVKSP